MTTSSEIDQNLYDRIVQLVSKETGRKIEKIKPQSRLFQDFGVDGTDGENLLVAIRDEFNIDFSEFKFDRHFGPETGANPFAWIYWLLCEREKLNERGTAWKMVPITIMDLYEAAATRKFPDMSQRPAE